MATTNIAASLAQHARPVGELHTHPDNPRRGDITAIKESLSLFGQVRPVVALPDGTIVAGNHTFLACQELGWDKVAAVQVDLSPSDARRYLIADNRLADRGSYDEAALAEILGEMMDAGQLSGTGYTPDDVDDLLSELGKVAVTPDQEFQGDYAETPEDTAARYTAPGEGVRMREALLMYPEAQFEEFSTMLRALQKAWGIDSARDVVFEAIRRAAAGADVEAPVPADA